MSNGHGDSYQDDYQPQPAVAIRADAPTRIFCFIDDLFFLAKIQETARKLGVKVEFVKGDKESVARLTDLPEAERPKLVVFDLNNLNAKPMSLIPKFKTKFKKATSIVGYLNHLQGELKAKAIEAGCDAVMPRSAFSQTLPNLLRRYGLDEEEDHTPQPV
jgi:DNA-binding NarL/FixJ family response regulator